MKAKIYNLDEQSVLVNITLSELKDLSCALSCYIKYCIKNDLNYCRKDAMTHNDSIQNMINILKNN